MKEKTATSGVRYKINDIEFIKKRQGLKTLQEVFYFLVGEYIKLYRVEKPSIFTPTQPKDFGDSEIRTEIKDEVGQSKVQTEIIDPIQIYKQEFLEAQTQEQLERSYRAMEKEPMVWKSKVELRQLANKIREEKGFIYND